MVRRGEQNTGLGGGLTGTPSGRGNDPNSRREAELGPHGEVAIVTMFATDQLSPHVKTQDVDVLTVGHARQFGIIVHALP